MHTGTGEDRDLMKTGKLTNEQLSSIVLSKLPKLSDNTLVGADIGADCAWINLGDKLMVISSDPITAGGMQSGTLTVHVSCNDIAACGVHPSGILIDIVAPSSATEEDISEIVTQASREAEKLGVDIVGGHTEVSDSVKTFVVISTAFGLVDKEHPVPRGKARAGDKLIQTKMSAIEGSYIAATEHKSKLYGKVSSEYIDEASKYNELISVVNEGSAAGNLRSDTEEKNKYGYFYGAADLMHDVTEGGVLGAAYEMAHYSGLGVNVYEENIPISDASRAICNALDIDPLRLISSGSLLIASAEPDRVIAAINDAGVEAAVIGEFTETSEGFRITDKTGRSSEMAPPGADEIYRI